MEILQPVEVRVLGALMEKETTTPEYYPMTLNALVNACNQKTNREPVTHYDDAEVSDAIESLRHRGFTTVITGAGSRVPKYGQRFGEKLNLGRRDAALLCVLMLRGAQTLGELKDRSERLHSFSDLEEVESCLEGLAARELAQRLPRQPGQKEARFVQLLGGTPEFAEEATAMTAPGRTDRVALLEDEVRVLRKEIERLREEWVQFRRQFE